MALTRGFAEAVSQGNKLRVKIMLKDSLLVDTTFNQFNKMLHYAEQRMSDFWVSDDEDNEEFSQSSETLDAILAGLVNKFSKRRVTYLKGMISKMYPSDKPKSGESKDRAVKRNKQQKGIINAKKRIVEICSHISSKKQMTLHDIEQLRSEAMKMISYCDNIIKESRR